MVEGTAAERRSQHVTFPRLRENVWHIDPSSESANAITTTGTFNVPTTAALRFLELRSYCTGHNSLIEIAARSGVPLEEVEIIVDGLARAGLVTDPSAAGWMSPDEIRRRLVKLCTIWSHELTQTYIGNEFAKGELPGTALIGWLIEMYHYVRDFPAMISHAADRASGALQGVLREYARQETGHEEFLLRTLVNLGFKRDEVAQSAPLLATRLIGFLVRELAELEPSSMLLVASLLEAQEFDAQKVEEFKARLETCYGFPARAFDPYFEHQAIDVELRHSELLADHLELLEVGDEPRLDSMVDHIHDLKHAFDLQGLEIKAYFASPQGRYIPRQKMTLATT